MTPKIKQRIEQLCRSEIPEGYKKTKAGILPVDWDVHMLGECLSRVERPVEVMLSTGHERTNCHC